MNSILTQPNFEYALFAAVALLIVAATAALVYVRNRKLESAPSAAQPMRPASAATKTSHAMAMSQAGAVLPSYPERLERRNREALAARAATTARRPGVAARWKSGNRVAIGM